jgi:hypothetical protein
MRFFCKFCVSLVVGLIFFKCYQFDSALKRTHFETSHCNSIQPPVQHIVFFYLDYVHKTSSKLIHKSISADFTLFFLLGKHRRSVRLSSRHDERRALADDPGDDRGRLEEQEARHA